MWVAFAKSPDSHLPTSEAQRLIEMQMIKEAITV